MVSHLDFFVCSERKKKVTVRRLKDESALPAKKRTFDTNNSKFFLERASNFNFCCPTNQNNSRKYVLYDSRLL